MASKAVAISIREKHRRQCRILVAAVNRAAFRVEPPAPQSHVDQGHSDIFEGRKHL